MLEGDADTTVGARENGIELGISKLFAGVEQALVGPEVVFEEVGKSGNICYLSMLHYYFHLTTT
ncbi:hypothetical protein KDAU_73960 [Dictyobacter aurantiacus]|uniref:Uncharacterized protein n=1 Tax=Dictyobacter aurantiacus TaxID=1936993 RepID=A0A401ZT75_9CHLR|nr:hypothetical protein KDAU_73960 [Dictyobacter aurantiacus]